ncbi:hypothetical protein EJ06DRAFT_267774 [Trichodelitschia bisporula]|uniref:Uncharacterized protein n=1 Tax=Trichodelitschia bisporula TaxID=703511 RepID=A0A6G1HIK1_9PEZI|nr:hypothetical protein EJ06DRAFT_267774 [Trichodelitschia bisporula]
MDEGWREFAGKLEDGFHVGHQVAGRVSFHGCRATLNAGCGREAVWPARRGSGPDSRRAGLEECGLGRRFGRRLTRLYDSCTVGGEGDTRMATAFGADCGDWPGGLSRWGYWGLRGRPMRGRQSGILEYGFTTVSRSSGAQDSPSAEISCPAINMT